MQNDILPETTLHFLLGTFIPRSFQYFSFRLYVTAVLIQVVQLSPGNFSLANFDEILAFRIA